MTMKLCTACLLLVSVLGQVEKPKDSSQLLSFEEYVQKFQKSWRKEEWNRRKQIYEKNLERIQWHNEHRSSFASISHWLGVDEFSDMEPHELFLGYDKTRRKSSLSLLKTKNEDKVALYDELERLTGVRLDDPVESLPCHVDWRKQGVTTPVKSQGQCGSCWAFASTAVLESHLALQTGTLFELSVQELVSCVPNPNHCGGTGGCAGSTSELAFEHVITHGMVSEWEFGYQSYHPNVPVNCSLPVPGIIDFDAAAAEDDIKESVASQRRKLLSGRVEGKRDTSRFYKGAVMGIEGWVSLPSNDYTAVMNAVAKLGPLAVSVACHPWFGYSSGVFQQSNFSKPQDTDVNHLVVLEGYGTDKETGLDYWLVRNSWGFKWGEGGYIRLHRSPNSICGMDVTPGDGVACTNDNNGQEITPPDALICGNSGILYDVTVPIRAFVV